MHEYSVIQSFLEMCEEYVKQNHCSKVLSAKIKAGILSGIELSLFKRALEEFKIGSVLENAKVEYIIQPLKIQCFVCGEISQTYKHQVLCMHCQSQNVKILDGEEFILLSLEME